MKRKRKQFSVEERLEVVRARQRGLGTDDVAKLYGVHRQTVSIWTQRYEARGLPGLEAGPYGPQRRVRCQENVKPALDIGLSKVILLGVAGSVLIGPHHWSIPTWPIPISSPTRCRRGLD